MFHADLHIHSRYSRACSRDCTLPQLASWALRKGIAVVGTGDFTHPGWAEELKADLIPAEPGLLRLRPELEEWVRRATPASCVGSVRFMLSVEISTIYRRGERTRKVHHLIYSPSFEAAARITAALSRIGNLASDGRPILGLNSRDLLEITLEADPSCYLVPAHIWTPWFAVLGSRSGFDAVTDCYEDLTEHVFALETGLSSDPPMNWMCSWLDRYRLVSNSDAHSPPMLGREATAFATAMDYFAIADALRTGHGLVGTIEFYPEEGKYHYDGHRKCAVRFDPRQTDDRDGICPACGRPLTVGVLHRVTELADRPYGHRPPHAAGYTNLVPLPEIVAEILAKGTRSAAVATTVNRLVAEFGPELTILREVPVDDLARVGGDALGEAIARLRRGEVIKEAGYDGEYGRIRLFQRGELDAAATLFPVPAPPVAGDGCAAGSPRSDGRSRTSTVGATGDGRARRRRGSGGVPGASTRPGRRDPADGLPRDRTVAAPNDTGDGLLAGLDPEQRAAATTPGPLMIIAGPGTGKTRTLTHRIAHQVIAHRVPAERFLAITFTRRAAQEMRERLAALLPSASVTPGRPVDGPGVTVSTFHGLALRILRDYHDRAGLPAGFRVVDGTQRDQGADAAAPAASAVDLADLVPLAVRLLRTEAGVAARLRERWPWISVDEYQDVDGAQYELLRLLAGDGRGLTVIGDPDQAIYGFRGADVGFFLRFATDYPAAKTVHLTKNYRSAPGIVASAVQAIAPATLVADRRLEAVAERTAPDPAFPTTGGHRDVVTVHEAADEHAEATWIAESIDRLLGGASFHSLDSGRVDARDGHGRLSLSDVAVLYRVDTQAAPLAQALTRLGLPFQKRSHDLLLRRPGVREVVDRMRLADPGPGAPDGDPVVDRLRDTVRTLTTGWATTAGAAVDIRTAGEVLAPLARRCGTDMDRFLTEITLGAEVDALDPRADVVSLLTLHAAKGLEFEVVFIAGCERGLLPLRLPGAPPRRSPASGGESTATTSLDSPWSTPPGAGSTPMGVDVAEERRLLFVGMTRARSRLFLSYANRRGARSPAGPSPFLTAIDPALLARSAPVRRRPGGRQLRLL